ncbi:DUF2269 domain-containing protein [Candidatus Berkiella cookevillensis]|uniref:DUF2269 domain-containing protein n=1 Tax=Candidatus Berkiella cookevillensis TaxID=437022 RepID=A0A0Q9YPB2_9GAMM|nr:DUF2269 domain-containing protein [Candidatus Berkiella cookevillensis]MCS5708152.1 DUF2269 domain-containing protein [Candidatus Berkiella cookevillensis]
MKYYFILKLIHILSATVLMGTGAGIAFFMLMSYLKKDMAAIKQNAQLVVLADWLFTLPAVIVQLVSGLLLMHVLNYSYHSMWFASVMGLFVFVGCCWIPVLYLQYQFRTLSKNLSVQDVIPNRFHRYMKIWIILGCFGFSGVLLLFYLMVFKPML